MFTKIKQLWNDNGFEIILGLCVAFILLFALYRKVTGGKGTWSKKKYYSIPRRQYNKPRRQLPRESKGEEECRRVLQLSLIHI